MMPITLYVSETQQVSALLTMPPETEACYIMAHGAGAGMTHPFMAAVADGLAARRCATLRYQFPFVENGSRRPDAPAVAHATVRAAVLDPARRVPSMRAANPSAPE